MRASVNDFNKVMPVVREQILSALNRQPETLDNCKKELDQLARTIELGYFFLLLEWQLAELAPELWILTPGCGIMRIASTYRYIHHVIYKILFYSILSCKSHFHLPFFISISLSSRDLQEFKSKPVADLRKVMEIELRKLVKEQMLNSMVEGHWFTKNSKRHARDKYR